MLRRIFGLKRDELMIKWRKLHNLGASWFVLFAKYN
jgi:hypothetical protein